MEHIYQSQTGAFELSRYLEYLTKIEPLLPLGASEFAMAPWHYKMGHKRCPHDSWIEALTIKEDQVGAKRAHRAVNIDVTFLSSSHDGIFNINYSGVLEYQLNYVKKMGRLAMRYGMEIPRGHGDWIIDEIVVTAENRVRHEIKFREAASLIIVCEDLNYSWTDLSPSN